MTKRLPVTTAHHVAMDFETSPDIIWAEIVAQYVEGSKFSVLGKIEPLDDPAAPLGAYRVVIEGEDGAVDERIARVTERDEAARRLSIFADYLSPAGGMQVFATYQAIAIPRGARFTLDCHARYEIEAPDKAARAEIAATIARNKVAADEGMLDFLRSLKAKLEAPD